MTPEQLAKSGSEDALQMALFAALNAKQLELTKWPTPEGLILAERLRWVHAIPNGGQRHKAVAGKMKATGAKSGVWDIFAPVPKYDKEQSKLYNGLYVEMKTPDRRNHKNGGLSDIQVEFRDFVAKQGYAHCVAYGWEEALTLILNYLKD